MVGASFWLHLYTKVIEWFIISALQNKSLLFNFIGKFYIKEIKLSLYFQFWCHNLVMPSLLYFFIPQQLTCHHGIGSHDLAVRHGIPARVLQPCCAKESAWVLMEEREVYALFNFLSFFTYNWEPFISVQYTVNFIGRFTEEVFSLTK